MSTRPQIEMRLKAGMGKTAIANELGVTRWWVRYVARTMGKPIKASYEFPKVDWSPEMLATLEDFVNGAPLKPTAARIGVHPATMAHGLVILLRAERERRAAA